jgi:hypothetical protein
MVPQYTNAPADLVVAQFDEEASQTRDCCAAIAALRAARPDSLDYARDRLFAVQKRLAQDDKANCTNTADLNPWQRERREGASKRPQDGELVG